MESEQLRTVGTIGLVGGALLVVANLVHPFGNTGLYSSGVEFVEHTGTFWIWLHFAIAATLLIGPLLAHAWYRSLTDSTAIVWGRLAFLTVLLGTTVGVVHLAGIDGSALPAWQEVLDSGAEGAELGADLLMRVHLTTFVSWTFLFFGFAQLFLAVTEFVRPEGNRLLGVLVALGGVLGLASAVVSGVGGQLTTATDTFMLRPSAALLTVWIFWEAWTMRSKAAIVSSGSAARTSTPA